MLTNLVFVFICIRASSAFVRTSAFLQPVVRGQVYMFEISPPLIVSKKVWLWFCFTEKYFYNLRFVRKYVPLQIREPQLLLRYWARIKNTFRRQERTNIHSFLILRKWICYNCHGTNNGCLFYQINAWCAIFRLN